MVGGCDHSRLHQKSLFCTEPDQTAENQHQVTDSQPFWRGGLGAAPETAFTTPSAGYFQGDADSEHSLSSFSPLDGSNKNQPATRDPFQPCPPDDGLPALQVMVTSTMSLILLSTQSLYLSKSRSMQARHSKSGQSMVNLTMSTCPTQLESGTHRRCRRWENQARQQDVTEEKTGPEDNGGDQDLEPILSYPSPPMPSNT